MPIPQGLPDIFGLFGVQGAGEANRGRSSRV